MSDLIVPTHNALAMPSSVLDRVSSADVANLLTQNLQKDLAAEMEPLNQQFNEAEVKLRAELVRVIDAAAATLAAQMRTQAGVLGTLLDFTQPRVESVRFASMRPGYAESDGHNYVQIGSGPGLFVTEVKTAKRSSTWVNECISPLAWLYGPRNTREYETAFRPGRSIKEGAYSVYVPFLREAAAAAGIRSLSIELLVPETLPELSLSADVAAPWLELGRQIDELRDRQKRVTPDAVQAGLTRNALEKSGVDVGALLAAVSRQVLRA